MRCANPRRGSLAMKSYQQPSLAKHLFLRSLGLGPAHSVSGKSEWESGWGWRILLSELGVSASSIAGRQPERERAVPGRRVPPGRGWNPERCFPVWLSRDATEEDRAQPDVFRPHPVSAPVARKTDRGQLIHRENRAHFLLRPPSLSRLSGCLAPFSSAQFSSV